MHICEACCIFAYLFLHTSKPPKRMKKEEICIGNLVQASNNRLAPSHAWVIGAIDAIANCGVQDCFVRIGMDNYLVESRGVVTGFVKPLPITPESLALLGFKKHQNGFLAQYGEKRVYVGVMYDGSFICELDEDKRFSLKHIHQLQNLCTVLGITLTPTLP